VSTFDHVDSIPPQQIWDGILSRAVHGNEMTLTLLELEPSFEVPEHSHPNEQIGILIEGFVTFRIGDETEDVRPGGTWRILANVPHSVKTGPDGAVIVEAFSPPRRDDWSAIELQVPGPAGWP
jgi:quercetin dioxygenase-like cupin family protein